MISLGLDPSLTGFGWVVHDSTVSGPRRVRAKGVFRTSASDIFVWRYMFLRQSLFELLDSHPEIECVGVESPTFGEEWSEGAYGLFLYVNEVMFTRRMDVVYFDPLRVKLLAKMDSAVRRGKMVKQDMMDAARADTTIKRWDNNEADAYIIARSAARFWEYVRGDLTSEELTPSEASIFLATRTFTRGDKQGKTVRTGLVYKEGDRFFQFSRLGPDDVRIPSKASLYHRSGAKEVT